MEQQLTTTQLRYLAGFTVRTRNADEFNPATAKIGPLIHRYMAEGWANQIPERVAPGVTYAVYSEYESNHEGAYSYFFGEEVASLDHLPEGIVGRTIPAAPYQRLTTARGPIPQILIEAWQHIWSDQALEEKRAYTLDFELYDARAAEPANAVVDVYIGVRQ